VATFGAVNSASSCMANWHARRVVADLAQQVTSISCRGLGSGRRQRCQRRGRQSQRTAGPAAVRSGPDWLGRALEPRHEHIANLALATAAEAQAVAEAAFDQRARRFVRLDGVAEGNAQLRVGTTVSVSGLSARWDNSYYVVEARHLYDVRAGYRTEFVGECAWLGDG
jgi:phage protein D